MSLYGQTFNQQSNSSLYGQTFNPNFEPKIKKKEETKVILPNPTFKMMSAHTPTSQEPSLGTAFIKGTLGSVVGRAVTPLVEKVTGRDVDLSTLPESETFGQKAIETGSNLVTDLPLWMAGDAVLAKPLGALAKTAPIAKTLNTLPKTITPALGTGVRAGVTYGGVVAPAETLVEGDGMEGLIEREKQVPLMAAGGTVLHGAGQVIGKGVKSGIDLARSNTLNKSITLPEVNPLEEVKNAYKSPTLRDAQANELNNTFADTPNLMSPVQLRTLEQGINEAVGVREPLSRELVRQRKADVKSALTLRPGEEVPLLQRKLPKTSKPLTWTNRDGIPNAGNLPITSITEENLGQLPGRQGNIPLRTSTSRTPNLGETTSIEIPMVNGRADLGNIVETPRTRTMNADIERPNETLVIEPVRPNSNNQINQLTQGNSNKIVGADPNIPEGLKERGVSENIRTDANRPDALRDSYSSDPLVYKQIGNKETLAKAQSIFDKGLEPAITELDTLIKDLKPEAAPLVKMLADKLTLDGNVARARELMSNAANRATESGQFGQAFRILRDADPETFLMTFDKMLKKLNKEGLETYGKKWKDFDLTPDELNLVNGIERGNQTSYDSVFEQIQSRIANKMPASAMEKINAWRHMSMLLNPKTHIRNVIGNGIMMGMRKSAQRVSGVLQKVVLPQEQRTQSVFVNKEYKDLANQYFETNKKDLLSGANKYQDNVSVTMPNKRVFRKSRIGEKLGKDIDILEKARKFNYELLQKGDNPFFKNAYEDRLASYAQAKGIKDFSKLPQEAFDIAKLEAEQATYKDASIIADFINKAKNPQKNASLGRKTGAVLTEAALPFTKTPVNIIKRGIQYSPVGVVNGLAKIKDIKSATIAIDELAKGLTGTGILGLGYLLASKGILTGKAEKDADLKAYNANTGNSPFSILGKYSYDWMQPFSIPLSVGVEVYNALKSNPEDIAKMNSIVEKNDTTKLTQITKDVLNGVYDAISASGDTVFNMSVLKGVKTLLANPNGVTEGIMQLPQSYATQFIPTISNQIAGAIDPTVRQTYVKGNYPESTKNAILSRIPIASKTLEPKQTPFGEDIKRIENPITRTASQFLSPGIVAKDQNIDPEIDTELRRLNEYGFTKQFPTMVPNYIEKTQTHPKVELTPKETTDYQKRVGQLTLKSFDKTMNSKDYRYAKDDKTKNKSADEIRADLLAKAISDAKAQAKKEILKSKGFK